MEKPDRERPPFLPLTPGWYPDGPRFVSLEGSLYDGWVWDSAILVNRRYHTQRHGPPEERGYGLVSLKCRSILK